MGSQQRYTYQQVIEALQATNGRPALAGDNLGCSARTVHRYSERYATVREVRNHLREKRKDIAEGKLWELIDDSNVAAVIFYLKTQAKDRGYVERQEITGAEGKPIEFIEVPMAEEPASE